MAKEKMAIKFEKPPVHVTDSGSLSINADDIFHSQAGQDVIFRMTTIEPITSIGKNQIQPHEKASE